MMQTVSYTLGRFFIIIETRANFALVTWQLITDRLYDVGIFYFYMKDLEGQYRK